MPGSSFGRLFHISTFGESHGPAIGVVIDGIPAGLEISEADIQKELDRRRPGQSSVTTPRKEADKAEILSGVFEGKTTGVPLAILIRNENQQSKDYSNLESVFRPGHADFTYLEKYGIRDHRGGGRSSGRETACRVAAGAVAKLFLNQKGVKITAYTTEVGGILSETRDFEEIERNAVRCPDKKAAEKMIALIEKVKTEGDSIGGIVEAVIQGCPIGLGDPAFDKLDAILSHAVMSIATIKGIEFGDGFAVSDKKGSENNDVFYHDGERVRTKTNHAGGILGGISTGEDITLRVAVKPPSSISKAQETVDTANQKQLLEVHGRHDPCICPRVVPVVEAMLYIALMDCYLVQNAYKNK